MKGRKPKYPQEIINELAARQAAGESASALSAQTGIPRSSIIRCRDSARLPAEIKSKAQAISSQAGTAKQVEKLYWKLVDALLRRGIDISPEFDPKDLAVMFEAAVKLKAVLPSPRSSRTLPEIQKAEETLMIFKRHRKLAGVENVEAKPAEASAERDLGGPKGDSSEAPSVGEAAGEAGQSGEEKGAA